MIMRILVVLVATVALVHSILTDKEGNRVYGSAAIPGGILRSVYIRNLISRMIEPYQGYEYPTPYFPHIKMPNGGFRFPSQYRPPFVYEREDPRIPILISSSLTPGSLEPRQKILVEPTTITITPTSPASSFSTTSPGPTARAPALASPTPVLATPPVATPVASQVPVTPPIIRTPQVGPNRQGNFHLLTTAREPQVKKTSSLRISESKEESFEKTSPLAPVVLDEAGEEARKDQTTIYQKDDLRGIKKPIQFPLIFPPGFGMYHHGIGHYHPESSPVSYVYKVERLPHVFFPPYTPHVYLILNNQPSLMKEPFGQITDLWATEKKPLTNKNENKVQITPKDKITSNIEPENNDLKGKSETLVFDEVKDSTENAKDAVEVVEEVTEIFVPAREDTEKSSWDDNSALYVEEFGTTIMSSKNEQ